MGYSLQNSKYKKYTYTGTRTPYTVYTSSKLLSEYVDVGVSKIRVRCFYDLQLSIILQMKGEACESVLDHPRREYIALEYGRNDPQPLLKHYRLWHSYNCAPSRLAIKTMKEVLVRTDYPSSQPTTHTKTDATALPLSFTLFLYAGLASLLLTFVICIASFLSWLWFDLKKQVTYEVYGMWLLKHFKII